MRRPLERWKVYATPCIPNLSRCHQYLYHTGTFNTARRLPSRARLLRVIRSRSSEGDTEFFDRVCNRIGDIRPFLRLGRERRLLASDRPRGLLRTGFNAPLRPAPANT